MPIDLTGNRYGRWTALEIGRQSKHRWYYWKCRCDCGTIKFVSANSLRSGQTQSCGCIKRELDRANPPRLMHGHNRLGKRSPEYSVWVGIRRRCQCTTDKRYPDYGGRGITLCARWQDFRNFLADMGPRPQGAQIERIDNNGNYEPGNCKWATPTEQARNKRSTHYITHNHKRLSMGEWAERTGIPVKIIWDRIVYRHWPIEAALTKSLRKVRRHLPIQEL